MSKPNKCAAPVPGGCSREAYCRGFCEAHFRRQNRNPEADLSRPVREDRGELANLSTRVTAETRASLDAAGVAYAVASEVLEAWANGTPLPKRPKRARAA